MLEDVLDAALGLAGWETWVISSDEAVLEVAARRHARPVLEERTSLLAAVRQVDGEATERGADVLAVMLADTPLATSESLEVALHTLGPVVIAPAGDGAGTNLLIRRPPRAIRPRFGPDSFARHRLEAERKALPVSIVRRRELAFDVDGPNDILTLLDSGDAGRTREICLQLDLAARIRVA